MTLPNLLLVLIENPKAHSDKNDLVHSNLIKCSRLQCAYLHLVVLCLCSGAQSITQALIIQLSLFESVNQQAMLPADSTKKDKIVGPRFDVFLSLFSRVSYNHCRASKML